MLEQFHMAMTTPTTLTDYTDYKLLKFTTVVKTIYAGTISHGYDYTDYMMSKTVVHTISIHELLWNVCEATWLQAWTTTCMFASHLQIDY